MTGRAGRIVGRAAVMIRRGPQARMPPAGLARPPSREATHAVPEEADISELVPGHDCIQADGFESPFGGYSELAIGERGTTHAVFGQGISYDTPGSVRSPRGR